MQNIHGRDPVQVKTVASSEIEQGFRDKWREASWTSDDDARQLEYLEQLQSLLIHGSKSEKDY